MKKYIPNFIGWIGAMLTIFLFDVLQIRLELDRLIFYKIVIFICTGYGLCSFISGMVWLSNLLWKDLKSRRQAKLEQTASNPYLDRSEVLKKWQEEEQGKVLVLDADMRVDRMRSRS